MDKSKIGLILEEKKISFICMPCENKIKNLGNFKINFSTNKNTKVPRLLQNIAMLRGGLDPFIADVVKNI